MNANYNACEKLNDGTSVTVRAIRPTDAAAILENFSAMDRDSVFMRFFTQKKELTSGEIKALTEVDFDVVVALVVTVEHEGQDKLIGGGRYITGKVGEQRQHAEIAFVTADGYRGRGVASLVLKHLLLIGRHQGVTHFEAEVVAQNTSMLAVFKRSGLPIRQQADSGVVHLTLALA
jgi:RimJ/RimL family protein N-acetyltransferase